MNKAEELRQEFTQLAEAGIDVSVLEKNIDLILRYTNADDTIQINHDTFTLIGSLVEMFFDPRMATLLEEDEEYPQDLLDLNALVQTLEAQRNGDHSHVDFDIITESTDYYCRLSYDVEKQTHRQLLKCTVKIVDIPESGLSEEEIMIRLAPVTAALEETGIFLIPTPDSLILFTGIYTQTIFDVIDAVALVGHIALSLEEQCQTIRQLLKDADPDSLWF